MPCIYAIYLLHTYMCIHTYITRAVSSAQLPLHFCSVTSQILRLLSVDAEASKRPSTENAIATAHMCMYVCMYVCMYIQYARGGE